MRKISEKNYFVFVTIVLITIIVCLYLFSWCKQYNDTKLSTSLVSNTLTEVKYDNLDSVLQERSFLIVYLCTTSEKNCRNFEDKFVDYINDNNLNSDIVYLSLGFKNDENNYLNKVYSKYKSKDLVKKVNKYPTLLVFNEGKIVDVLSSNDKVLSISKVNQFLEDYDL